MLACSQTEVSTGIRELLQPQMPAPTIRLVAQTRPSTPAGGGGVFGAILASQTTEEAVAAISRAASVVSTTLALEQSPQAGSSHPPAGVVLGDAAYKFGGERAETCIRQAVADVLAANALLHEYEIPGFLPEERVSVGLVLFCAVVESSRRAPSAFMRKQLPSFVAEFGTELLAGAMKTAAEKGVEHQINPEHVSEAWPEPCEALFEYFAERNPKALTTWLCDNNLNSGTRARAAGSVRLVKNHNLARELLRPLVEGAEVPLVVREAAVYALDPHLDSETEKNLRRLASESGTHRIVREAVEDLVDVA